MNPTRLLARAGVVAVSVLLAAGAIHYRRELSTWAATAATARADAPMRPTADVAPAPDASAQGSPYAATAAGVPRVGDRAAWLAHHRPDTPEVAPIDPETTVDTMPQRRIMFSGSKSGPVIPEPDVQTSTPQSTTFRTATRPASDSIRQMMLSRSGPLILPSDSTHTPASAPTQPSPESLARRRALLSGPDSGAWMLARPPADSSRGMNGMKSLPPRAASPIIRYTPERTENRFRNRAVDSSGGGTRTPHR